MNSHVPSQMFGALPRRKPNQHHLPPLLPPSSSSPNETISAVGCRAIPPRNALQSPGISRQSSASPRNCCSVTTMGIIPKADSRHAASRGENGVVGYAVEHQLPSLLNNMMEDLLRERPEENVDGWMFHWFERAYERRREETQRRPVHPRS
ncbi:hypothetical protein C3747_117g79 [Trypanosoma cruzi]|uniref:Uncharacterized protein n=2 Tax=Trypanosoma cruzi TaxID=5693 RepID=Q4CX79_TRYCC|nr:hypothetical protein, conserved [Trypanosoma cruzi]EAN84885.1 hypothetical protein, conserved [Trypanosoma cruzi]PWV06265.1 hypothetical protein C3747_117g79 [Trypanosoma cruzi]|eukprot:XP_806736.1 hypothetical protein [Trypanosoma cruzi strain CL Brener]